MALNAPFLLRTRAALIALLILGVLAATPALLALTRPPTPVPAGPVSAPYEPGVVVLAFRSGTSTAARRSALVHAGLRRGADTGTGFTTVALPSGMSVPAAVTALASQRSVAWAVPDYIAHAAQLPPPYVPNDPGSSGRPGGWEALQWNFAGAFGVGAPQAWANVAADGAPGGAGVIVAVLDTGIAYANHRPYVRSPDFRPGQFVAGYDFIARDSTPYDRNGHGTQVAGTIAEATNNRIGLTGLAYGAKLMPVRVLDSQGDGGAATIARGIYFAANHHAQIINLSLEFTAGTVRAASIPELIDAIEYAHSKDALVVAASGNDDAGQLSYPAKARWVVSVGATTIDGCLGYYSNFGPGLTLVAPGGGADKDITGDPNCHPATSPNTDIFQETFADVESPSLRVFGLPSGYFGTSMAAPHVSATAALIIASGVLGPHPTIGEIVARLIATAKPLGAGGNDGRHYGAGLVNAGAATAPIGSTGTTGPSGPTGTTGTTGAT